MRAPELTRRSALASAFALIGCKAARESAAAQQSPASAAFAELERSAGGRLGVAVVGADRAMIAGHRAHERFGMCSTFKMPLAGIVLREADKGRLDLDAIASYTEGDLLGHAPTTRAHLAEGGVSLEALAEAAQVTSDNTAANLLLARLGGPSGFTARLREIGDSVTRLDRIELEMNHVRPGEERDTTTPAAMAQTTLALLTGDVLTAPSRAKLLDWMRRTETGARRLRAGLPPEWNAGDKTGTGWYDDLANKYNDVAIAFPPGRGAVAIAAYYEGPGAFPNVRPEDEAVLAQVGRIAAELLPR